MNKYLYTKKKKKVLLKDNAARFSLCNNKMAQNCNLKLFHKKNDPTLSNKKTLKRRCFPILVNKFQQLTFA